ANNPLSLHDALPIWMDEIYGVFKDHVTEARGDKLKKPIDEIAGGRVYTGKQALELGLVDKIGGLDAAISDAAGKAGLDEGTYERSEEHTSELQSREK